MRDFVKYIGMRWEVGAVGPDTWDCMAFAKHIQQEHFSVLMPSITIPDYDDKKALVLLNAKHGERENWLEVKQPVNGDLVFIRSPMHYGVWLDYKGGGVLHCVRGQGVVFTRAASWTTSGFGSRSYLRHRSKL